MLLGTAVAAVLTAAGPGLAQANSAPTAGAQTPREFNVPAGPLSQSALTLSEQAGVQVVFDAATAGGAQASAVQGRLTVEDAIRRMLVGTGLSWRWLRPGVITLERAGAAGANGARVLGPVRVEGAEADGYFGTAGQAAGVNGTNGSKDITATEGTGSFTSGALTVGSKVPQAMKDVPQSVSVLTSERMQQQNITDFTTAMEQLPGVTLVQGISNLQSTFFSRGFQITSIQVDGGAPLNTSSGNNRSFFPQIDMSMYDHVELLRGADGLFNGYGNPSGSVNLVRKKPLDHDQVTVDAQAGSWNTYRVSVDATGPLALDGRLRGRLVTTWQDDHYFYDVAKDNKDLIYGILEFDATPSTLLTAGVDYTQQNSVPWQGGLPRYQTGADLKLPRSESLAFPWNRWDFTTREIFGGVTQKIGSNWTLKLNLTEMQQQSTEKVGYSSGTVNPLNDTGPVLSGAYNDYVSQQWSAEAVLSGTFQLLGQRQEVTIGANRASTDAGGETQYDNLVTSSATQPYQPYPGGPTFCQAATCTVYAAAPPINVFDFNPNDPIYTEPKNPLPNTRYLGWGTTEYVAYMTLRLTAFDRLHLTTGIRWSRYEYDEDVEFLNPLYRETPDNVAQNNFSWPPTVNLSFDVTKQLTAYVGYADIYQSNALQLAPGDKPLGPTTGSNIEGGLKWAPRNGRLNASVAVYRIDQKGFTQTDYNFPPTTLPNGTCCYVQTNGDQVSYGADLEVTGEIIKGWQLAASYTFDQTKYEGSYYGTSQGLPIVSLQPKNLYKLWTSYDFGAAGHSGWLRGLTLSGGVNGQSSSYQAGAVCVNLLPPDPITGVSQCVSSTAPNTVPYNFTVPAYAVFSARLDYRLSKAWSLALNLQNILDKTYYQTVGSVTGSNWYGAPRSFTLSVHAKW